MKKLLFVSLILLISISCKNVKSEPEKVVEVEKIEIRVEIQPEIVWKYDSGSILRSSPVLDGQLVYSGGTDTFFALNSKTGEVVWTVDLSAPVTSKAIVQNEKVYFESGEVIYVHSALTGDFLWKFVPEVISSEKYDYWDYHHSSPAIYSQNLYFGTRNGDLYVVDINTQETIWHYKIDREISSTPVVYENYIYITDWAGSLYALNMDKKIEEWKFEAYDSIQTIPAINDDYICIGSRDTNFYTLDRKTGEQVWKYTDVRKSWFTGSPVIIGDAIYAGSSDSKRIYAFEIATGEILWRSMTYGNVFSQPVINNNILYATSGNAYATPGLGYLTASDMTNGKIVWKYKSANIFTTPVITDNTLIFGSDDGFLYALNIDV